MGWPLLFLAIDIASIASTAIFGARVLARRPQLATAQLIALIAFNSICYLVLARYEYRYWIPTPYQFDIGGWASLLNFARNLTPGLFMVLCFNLFADGTRFPRWLLALFIIEMVLEVIAYRGLPQSGASFRCRCAPYPLRYRPCSSRSRSTGPWPTGRPIWSKGGVEPVSSPRSSSVSTSSAPAFAAGADRAEFDRQL